MLGRAWASPKKRGTSATKNLCQGGGNNKKNSWPSSAYWQKSLVSYVVLPVFSSQVSACRSCPTGRRSCCRDCLQPSASTCTVHCSLHARVAGATGPSELFEEEANNRRVHLRVGLANNRINRINRINTKIQLQKLQNISIQKVNWVGLKQSVVDQELLEGIWCLGPLPRPLEWFRLQVLIDPRCIVRSLKIPGGFTEDSWNMDAEHAEQ